MAGEEIAICTLIVSFGPFITSLYFHFTILTLVIIVAVMEVLKRNGLIQYLQENALKRKEHLRLHETRSRTATNQSRCRPLSIHSEGKRKKKTGFLKRRDVGTAV